MSKYVVTYHAHHPDEKIYKLIYATEVEISGKKVQVGHQDIVWDARDPKWKNRGPEDIADEQRHIVKLVLDKKASEKEKAEMKAQKEVSHFKDSVGQQL